MSFFRRHFILRFFIFCFILGLIFSPFFLRQAKSGTLSTSVRVSITECGNNIKEEGEECDGTDLDGQTCYTKGFFGGGELACNPNCTFNTLNCSAGGGGGGGGGFQVLPLADTKVIFQGRAFPASVVTLMKDAQIAVITVAGPDANFQITLGNLSAGTYIFSLFTQDSQGRRSTVQTFPVTIIRGATTTISGIFFAPTIDIDKREVKRGENLAIFGQSVSQAEVTIAVASDEEIFLRAKADKNGVYLYNFDTSLLMLGQHLAKSKSASDGLISPFGQVVDFNVGTRTVLKTTERILKGDLNNDGRVNLTDFSIAAYWYKKTLSPAFIEIEKQRLGSDGKVDLIDFSIMAYYWTG